MTTIALTVCAGVLLLSCGGEGDPGAATTSPSVPATATTTTGSPSETPASAPPAADPALAIQAYFTAQRTGDTATICALESDAFEIFRYGEAGNACHQNAANNQPQPVWADPVKIVSLEQSGDFASAVLQPNVSSPAQATIGLTVVDGEWLVASLS